MMGVVAALPFVFVVGILGMPVWFRLVNQIITPLFGKALVVCPCCWVPGVARTKDPAVFQTAAIVVESGNEVRE